MKALTLCQPYASLVAMPDGWTHDAYFAPKRVENRVWRTAYRGKLAIHAGKSRAWLGKFGVKDELEIPCMPFGALVAVCALADCVRRDDVAEDPHASGPWCWLLRDVVALRTPVPCAGAMSLWDLPPAVLAALEAQLKGGGT